MKRILITAIFSAACATAQVQAGAAFSGDGLKSFYFAVGNYYHVPEREVIVIRERSIPPEEIPVVYFIAQRARVAPAAVVDFRLRGRSWWDVAVHFGVNPTVYYFDGGPPYGKAWGHYKKTGKVVMLRDPEIIDGVNVHFLSGYHRVPPDVVWVERSKGKGYVTMASNFHGKGKGHGDSRGQGQGQGHGHGKGKGKGK